MLQKMPLPEKLFFEGKPPENVKVFIPFPEENWSQDFIISTFRKYTSLEIVDEMYKADVVWFSAGWIFNHYPTEDIKRKKVVVTIHHRTPWKKNQWLPSLMQQNEIADVFHVPCKITKEYLEAFVDKPVKILPYWIDTDDFYPISKGNRNNPSRDVHEIKRKFNVDNGLITIGSFQRDTEGFDNKTPKLEKGPDYFCKVIKRLVSSKSIKGVNVLLGGWRRDYVIGELRGNSKINLVYAGRVSYEEVNELYNVTDVYLVTSRVEGGPQALFEAAACKTPILTTPVGSFEAVDPFCHCHSIDEFVHKILFYDSSVVDKNYELMRKNHLCENLVPVYDEFLNGLGQ